MKVLFCNLLRSKFQLQFNLTADVPYSNILLNIVELQLTVPLSRKQNLGSLNLNKTSLKSNINLNQKEVV